MTRPEGIMNSCPNSVAPLNQNLGGLTGLAVSSGNRVVWGPRGYQHRARKIFAELAGTPFTEPKLSNSPAGTRKSTDGRTGKLVVHP